MSGVSSHGAASPLRYTLRCPTPSTPLIVPLGLAGQLGPPSTCLWAAPPACSRGPAPSNHSTWAPSGVDPPTPPPRGLSYLWPVPALAYSWPDSFLRPRALKCLVQRLRGRSGTNRRNASSGQRFLPTMTLGWLFS